MKVDISRVLRSSRTALEKQATDTFGAAVEDFARGALGIPSSRATPIGLGATQQPKSSTWNATSYAAVLAGATPLRPKLKFLFKVQFVFNEAVLNSFPGELARQLRENRFTFLVKAVDRPKVDFEYEDDVNMYNYRTKVLKKIRHRELTLTFMDDVGNNVFDFFRTLMMIYSPITRQSAKRDGDVVAKPDGNRFNLGSGMTFSDVSDFKQDDVAHRGVINANAGTAIELIRVKQIFIDPSTPTVNSDNAVKAVFYDFVNPRLVSFDLDDLSHESSDVNLLTMQFDYDWLEMTKHDNLIRTGDGGPEQTVVVAQEATEDAVTTGIPRDILQGVNSQEAAVRSSPAQSSGQGSNNPFVNILGGAANRAVTTLTSTTVNRAVKQIAGNGRFANSVIGRSVLGGIGTVVSGVSSSLGGLVGGAVRDNLGGLFSTANQSTARSSRPLFNDTTTAGGDSARSSASSSDFYAPSNPAVRSPSGDF